MTGDFILAARGLARHYPVRSGLFGSAGDRLVKAVDGVDLEVSRGETVAIVGESGCGKSTLARLLLRLERPDRGEVWFEGTELAGLGAPAMRILRRKLQIIFQDPFSSLNPCMTMGELVEEPLIVHQLGGSVDRRRRVRRILDLVGLAASRLDRYPHEFSGGQRQRIGIARALVCGPELVIGDEPVSALDVSVQAQILNLLQDLKNELGLTLIVITHDLAVVRHMADRVGVMYLGRLVEFAPASVLFEAARHPYTQALLAAVPRPDPARRGERRLLEGDLPSPVNSPSGCRFHTRCPHARADCSTREPPLDDAPDGAIVACHYWREIATARNAEGHEPSPVARRRLELWAAARACQDEVTRAKQLGAGEVGT